MSTKLEIAVEESSEQVCVLRLSGELDGRGGPVLMAAWRAQRRPGRTLVIHLAGVEFISSSGVGALLAILEESNDRGEEIHLMAPSTNVRSVMRLLGLERFLPVVPDGASLPMRKAG